MIIRGYYLKQKQYSKSIKTVVKKTENGRMKKILWKIL